MKIVITGQNIKISDQLNEKIEKKFNKFNRYFDDKSTVSVKVRPEANKISAEITMKIHKHYYRAEALADSVMSALDEAISIMEGQIRKHKTRMVKNVRDFAYMNEFLKQEMPDLSEDLLEPDAPQIIRRKTFTLSPMSPEEAVLQMELLGHAFLLYLSPETGQVCLVYKRKDGNYGLLEPEY